MTTTTRLEAPARPGTRVLIIVQNLPVPLDRRVWLECQALRAQGYSVSVICPKGPGDPAREVIDGIGIYKYRPAPEARGATGFAIEFALSWIRTAALSLTVRRERGFDVIQACNPPDTYWLLGLLWRRKGVRFIFDHHDLNPELFLSRFGRPRGLAARFEYKTLLWLERMTFRVADHVISTNNSYRAIALRRGHLRTDQVTVVRSGPDTRVMRPIQPAADVAKMQDYLLVYLGIMGPQDNVDKVLEVVSELVQTRGRTDVRAVLMGFGDCLEALKAQSIAMGLGDRVHFTGRVGPETIANYLSAANIGVGPDEKTPLNDLSTMNKTMEYMAYALPSVSFDLTETRVSGGDSAIYVPSGDIGAFADAVELLLDDPEARANLGRAARTRVASELDWQHQAQAYIRVFDTVLQRDQNDLRAAAWPFSNAGLPARPEHINLDDAVAYEKFLVSRGRHFQAPEAEYIQHSTGA
ncbi:glycosyltransferase family 4 protein [Cryobacterium psychrophilum]|uniref:Glycosyltransferase WbuB n=1 Tax=Cryobacterium psychrophilum TaxID=41988 RepID=A0A4Y8KLG3_9MICO|nr:glycosyltransferase family 4 protein [Cryobacterium psychrophilum]TDW29929.1 glycosyltransferase involved in cell wall biosynthesis [Cryobacterium psychrophilum]TFD76493.1 glycosyltransferase WbuB [Cryobacterium psychrophilum]